MQINNRIREQVVKDLSSAMVDSNGKPLVKRIFNGFPAFLEVADPSIPDSGDLPAIGVSISEGESDEDSMESETWKAALTVRIYLESSNHVESELDALGEKVLETIGTHYTADGLLDNCNRQGFSYVRDEEQPWGMLDLTFIIEYNEEV